jgi:hypothetical protein
MVPIEPLKTRSSPRQHNLPPPHLCSGRRGAIHYKGRQATIARPARIGQNAGEGSQRFAYAPLSARHGPPRRPAASLNTAHPRRPSHQIKIKPDQDQTLQHS